MQEQKMQEQKVKELPKMPQEELQQEAEGEQQPL